MMVKKKQLRVDYDRFAEILRQWDDYLFIEMRWMPLGYSTWTNVETLEYGSHFSPNTVTTEDARLADLSELLWLSLQSTSETVAEIHGRNFAQRQVEHFINEYIHSAEHLTPRITEEFEDRLPPPTELFLKLSKPAQLRIVMENLLTQASEAYNEAKEIVANKAYEKEAGEEHHKYARRIALREKRKAKTSAVATDGNE